MPVFRRAVRTASPCSTAPMSSSSPAVSWARTAAGIGGPYAVMPELFLKMNELIEKGDIPAAREIQYKADRIIYKMCEAHGNLYAVMKEILRRMYGLELGGVRAPLPGLIPEDEPIVAEAQKMIEDAVAAL